MSFCKAWKKNFFRREEMKTKSSKALTALLGAALTFQALPAAMTVSAAGMEKVDISHGSFSSSPSYAGYEGRGMDGDLNTQWAAKGAGECWLQADFETPISFNCIKIYETTTYGERLVGARLETSATGEEGSWSVVQSFDNLANGIFNEELLLDETLTSSHIRVVLDGGSKEINVNEVEFYNKEVTAREQLAKTIAKARGIDTRLYTIQSARPLSLALASANVVYKNESMLDGQILDAKRILEEAIDGLQVFGENLALHADASANSTYEGSYDQDSYGAEFTTDGSLVTRWASKDEADGFVFELTVDLKEAKTFNQVVVHETKEYQGRIKSVSALVSDDDENWNEWRMGAEHFAPTSSLVGEPVTARYIRVQIEENGGTTGMNVDELQVYMDENAIETSSLTPARPVDPNWIAPVPSKTANTYQLRKQKLGYGMFIHYGVNTFTNNEWGNGREDVSVFNPDPETYDPEQWAKAAYEAGMNYVVLITKHHDGFAMFDSKYTDHKVTNCGHEGVDFDVVERLSQACNKYGIKLGLYYSIWDMNWEQNHPQSDYIDLRAWDQAYTDYAYNQIEELMTNYGEICELWIDGGWQKETSRWEYERIYDMVKRHQPGCQMSVNLTMGDRDIAGLKGGEEIVNFPSDFKLYDGRDTAESGDPKVFTYQGQDYYLPFEGTFIIGNGWFWNSNSSTSTLRVSAAQIKSWYEKYMHQDNTLVINVPPSNKGVQTEHEVGLISQAAREIGIARGDARADKQENECEVEIRYVTTEGEIASPTRFLYGKAGEAYQAEGMEDAKTLGYSLAKTPANSKGVFETDRIVVEYVYNDDLKNPPEEQKADKTLLASAIDYAKKADTARLNAIVAAAYSQALESAETVNADPDASQSAVNEVWSRLVRMIHLLSFTSSKDALSQAVSQAEAIDLSLYLDDEAKTEFVQALENAKAVLNSETALDETSIDPALIRLENAAAGLHLKDQEIYDLSILNLLIETGQSADLSLYGDTGKAEFIAALAKAEEVKANPQSQQQIDDAANILHEAWLNLRLAANEDLLKALEQAAAELRELSRTTEDPALEQLAADLESRIAAHRNGTFIMSEEEAKDCLKQAESFLNKQMTGSDSSANKNKPAAESISQSAVSAKSVKTADQTGTAVWSAIAVGALAGLMNLLRRNGK